MYYFFFSYSRHDNNEFLKVFYSDLDKAVQGIVGEDEVSFIDQSGNEPGDIWEANLERALASSRVFVAVATASYCKKEYCGKEWSAFQTRIATYARAKGHRIAPPLAIPLLWIPPPKSVPFPVEIGERHFHVGDPASLVNKDGIFHLTKLKSHPTFQPEYVNLVKTLAERIIDLATVHQDMDNHATVPRLSTIASSFRSSGGVVASAAISAAPNTGGGPKRVHFVYGAGSPEDAVRAGRAFVEAYGDSGGIEWQPFYPSKRTLGEIAQHVASADRLGMISEELPMSADLDLKIRELEEKKRLVIILLDCWTTRIPTHQQALARFDRGNYVNCSVLLLHNRNDEETQNNWTVLEQSVQQVLFHRFRNANDLFLRRGIDEEAQCCAQIEDVLTRLRAEVINHSSPNLANLPVGGARPSISGPGAASE